MMLSGGIYEKTKKNYTNVVETAFGKVIWSEEALIAFFHHNAARYFSLFFY